MPSITVNRRLRTTLRNSCKHLFADVESCISSYENEKNDTDKINLINFKDILSEKCTKIKTLDETILNQLLEDEQIEDDYLLNEQNETTLFEIQLKKYITSITHCLQSENIESGNLNTTVLKNTVNLPKINIKNFDGTLSEWQTFYENFQCAIDSNKTISDVQKFTYLRQYLEGPAQETIGGFKLCGENYKDALKLLKETYGNPQIIINTHIQNLINFEAVHDINDIDSLRTLYNHLEVQIRSLKNLGENLETYGTLLIPILMSKIPEEINLIINRRFKNDEKWDISQVIKEFKSEINAREKTKLSSQPNLKDVNKYEQNISASSLTAHGETNSCIFCKRTNHKSQNCRTISNFAARKKVIRDSKRCFICLKQGHFSNQCKSKISCFKCSERHHAAICPTKKPVSGDNLGKKDDKDDKKEDTPKDDAFTGVSSEISKSTILQTAIAKVENPDSFSTGQCRILFDNCSQLSYITPDLCRKLNLVPKAYKDVAISVFRGTRTYNEHLPIVEVIVKGEKNENLRVECFVTEICTPLKNHKLNFIQSKFNHLKNVKLADSNPENKDLKVDMLIGADFYWDFISNETIRGNKKEPVALKSKLGYILSGPFIEKVNKKKITSNVVISHVFKIQAEQFENINTIQNNFQKAFEFETPKVNSIKDEENIFTHESFKKEIKFNEKEGRYQVPLPFIENKEFVNDNYSYCVSRLKGLTKKLKNNNALLERYNDIIKEQLKSGVIETVDDCYENIGGTHYLSHRPVIREDKLTTKIRMVFDASSAKDGRSLNECLHQGPNLTEPLLAVLLRFRVHPYAFIADIEKAYLQISLYEPNTDYFRFLWFSDIDNLNSSNISEKQLQSYRLCRVLFGVTSSSYLLSATLTEHLKQFIKIDAIFINKLLKSLHVDDLTSGTETKSEAIEFYEKSQKRLGEGSFNLRKFISNCADLNEHFNSINKNNEQNVKVLGITWDNDADKFYFDFKIILKDIFPTTETVISKRDLLRFIASLYDPLGLLNPFTVKLKILFQNVCKKKLMWEDLLSGELLKEWLLIRKDLEAVGEVVFDRCYRNLGIVVEPVSIELQGFADASICAYGCVIYIRYVYPNGVYHVSLVTAKSRVAPVKSITVPRLELKAAVLLSNYVEVVYKHLIVNTNISKVMCWSDSTIVLAWIKNNKKQFEIFVQRRLNIIRSNKIINEWHHIDTTQNPADILSRGALLSVVGGCELWRCGPRLLGSDLPRPDEAELTCFVGEGLSNGEFKTFNTIETENSPNLDKIFDINNYSSHPRLIRITAYVLRFISNIKRRKKKEDLVLFNYATKEEIRLAEEKWIISIQNIFKLDTKRYDQLNNSLKFFVENGIIRCRGRLKNSPLNYDAKFPIFLPKEHFYTELYVKFIHELVFHNGVKETLNEIRNKFWITQGRNFIKRIIFKCTICRRFEGPAYKYPDAPDLPSIRLCNDFPFKNTGVDYAGPLYVRNIYGNDKTVYKSWIFLFTCASTRCIYLELVPDCQDITCIRALSRFFSERGVPSFIISDNGSQFISDDTQSFISSKGITWKFNLAAAPWWGGMFERLIKSTKRCLKKVLCKTLLNYEEMLTVLAKIQVIINNRPLTFSYEEPGDQVLTPNHLLFGRKINLVADNSVDEEVQIDVHKRYKHLNSIISHFKNRWLSEYVTALRETHKSYITRTGSSFIINKNDVVLVYDPKKPRILWNMGVVQDIIKSKDGNVRGAVVRYVKNDRTHVIQRPINKLYPVEVNNNNMEDVPLKFIDERNIVSF